MDTVILGLLVLVSVLLILLLLFLVYLIRYPKKQKTLNYSTLDPSLLRLHQEQILENRRLVNILITRNPAEFQMMTSVNPENLGTSPITNPPQTSSGSENNQDYIWDGEGIPSDEGFDPLPHTR